MSNVIRLISPAKKARSRNREEALSAIIPRVRSLLNKGSNSEVAGLPAITSHIANISIVAVRLPGGTYFTIMENKVRRMAGHLDPDPLGRYLAGTVHISFWKRGDWESELFRT